METDNQNILSIMSGEISMVQAFQSAKSEKSFYVFYDTNANKFASREEMIFQVPKVTFRRRTRFLL